MSLLFEPSTIGRLTLPNRFVRSATFEGLATPEGAVTPALTQRMVELALGQVGLIITGHTMVSLEGRAGPCQMAAHSDAFLPGLTAMTQAVHKAQGRIALQLAHAGYMANTELSGLPALGASDFTPEGGQPARAATVQDLARLVQNFAMAAQRAKTAGFDAVQVHAAHGYLLSQFLSPYFNKRQDQYGGPLENRARLLLEVVRAIRQAVGPDYPLLVKLNSEDFIEPGLVPAEAIQVAALLEQESVDAVELSGGCKLAGPGRMPARQGRIKSPEDEGYYRQAARMYQQEVGLPLILVGGLRSLEVAEALVRDGVADFISLCRPLIREPGLIKRWREGDRRPSACLSDNLCYGPAFDGRGVFCVAESLEKDQSSR